MYLEYLIAGILLGSVIAVCSVRIGIIYQRWFIVEWNDANCDCTCKKCACHRPLEDCK